MKPKIKYTTDAINKALPAELDAMLDDYVAAWKEHKKSVDNMKQYINLSKYMATLIDNSGKSLYMHKNVFFKVKNYYGKKVLSLI